MDKFVLGIFVDEIIHQCEFALMNWFDFKAGLKKREDPKHLFGHIQAFLVAVANISKLLWPQKEFKSRGQ